MSKDSINIKNKKASHEYEFIDKFVAGIVLKGTEIKSIRNSQVSMSDAHCIFIDNELWLKNLHISEYKSGGYINHKPKRERKLLLNRQELEKIHRKIKIKGMSIIPVRLFINEKGKAKVINIEDASEFNHFFRITNNNYHPNEITAEYFRIYILNLIENIKSHMKVH